jgi:hypothetical protein
VSRLNVTQNAMFFPVANSALVWHSTVNVGTAYVADNSWQLVAAAPVIDLHVKEEYYSKTTLTAGGYRYFLNLISGGAYSTTRANTTAYTVGVWALWTTGTTVWECTTAGTSASSAPSIVGKVVGDTVSDGTSVWTMRSLTAASFKGFGGIEP